MTVPRIEVALNEMDDFAIINQGAKPQTQYERSRIAVKFLNLCDRPKKYGFYDRFNKQTASMIAKEKVASDFASKMEDYQRLKNLRNELDKKVIKKAYQVKNLPEGVVSRNELVKQSVQTQSVEDRARALIF